MGLDIYELIKAGKTFEEIADVIQEEYNAAEKRVEDERIAAEAEQRKQEIIKDTRDAAIAAMAEYFALVNPTIDKSICGSVLNMLENIKVTVSTSRTDGKSRKMDLIDSWLDSMFKL
jgi:uncharacterized protein (UPF0261 family)